MHLEPDPPERVVDQELHDPVRRVELIDDGQLVGRGRLALGPVPDALLLLDVEELVHPAKEIRGSEDLRRQPVVDLLDDFPERREARPELAVLVVGIEEDADLLRHGAEGPGEPVPEQLGLGVLAPLVLRPTGRTQVAEKPRETAVLRPGRDHLRGLAVHDQEPPRLHAAKAHEAVQERVRHLAPEPACIARVGHRAERWRAASASHRTTTREWPDVRRRSSRERPERTSSCGTSDRL